VFHLTYHRFCIVSAAVLMLAMSLIVSGCAPAQPPAPAATAPPAPTEAPTAAPQPTTPPQAAELKVGVILPFTGQYAWVGGNVIPVARMIAEEVNNSGGIGGSKIVLVQGDTEGVVDAGTTAAQKLVNVDGVLAFLGPTSLSFTGVKQIIQDNGVPMISPTAGTTQLDKAGKKYFFRTVPSDSLGGRAIARALTDPKFLGREGTFQRVSLMVGQAPALISFKDPIQEGMADYGGSIATTVEYKTDKQSYRSEVQETMKPDPDVIILVGTPEDSVRIMQAAFEAGYQGTWFVTQDQTNDDFIKLASPELVNGIYGLEEVPAAESAERTAAFKKRFADFTGGEEVKIFGTNTYDAMNVLALAMLRAYLKAGEVTREAIAENIREVANAGEGKVVVTSYSEGKEALEAGKEINYEGLVGPVDFDEYGNIRSPFGIRQVQDGKWVTVATVTARELE